MLERVILAAIITFCIYLFLNLGEKSSGGQSLETKTEIIPEIINTIAFFS